MLTPDMHLPCTYWPDAKTAAIGGRLKAIDVMLNFGRGDRI